jgi:hypothetical protein
MKRLGGDGRFVVGGANILHEMATSGAAFLHGGSGHGCGFCNFAQQLKSGVGLQRTTPASLNGLRTAAPIIRSLPSISHGWPPIHAPAPRLAPGPAIAALTGTWPWPLQEHCNRETPTRPGGCLQPPHNRINAFRCQHLCCRPRPDSRAVASVRQARQSRSGPRCSVHRSTNYAIGNKSPLRL